MNNHTARRSLLFRAIKERVGRFARFAGADAAPGVAPKVAEWERRRKGVRKTYKRASARGINAATARYRASNERRLGINEPRARRRFPPETERGREQTRFTVRLATRSRRSSREAQPVR